MKKNNDNNYDNEIQKKKYEAYLKGPKRHSAKTIDKKMQSLFRFDDFIKGKSYKDFNIKIAREFQGHLRKLTFRGVSVGARTIYQTLQDVQCFLVWLSQRPGFRSKIQYEHVEYLNPSSEIKNQALNQSPRWYPTNLNYVKKLVLGIRGDSELDKRDRAIISLLICTGIRVEALSTISIGCIDLDNNRIDQNPAKGVKTKFQRRITTQILPLDSIFLEAISNWVDFLVKRNVDSRYPLFPKAQITHEQASFSFINNLVSDQFIKSTAQISRILKKRCAEVGEKYYSAHTFRHLHVRLIEKIAKTPEDLKALSQNLGHKHLMTTMSNYGHISETDQVEILEKLDWGNVR